MKIIFFGSSHFALSSLKALIAAGLDISCVVTQPDKHKGRGMYIGATAIKQFAIDSGLSVFQPVSVNAPQSVENLKKLKPDLFVVVSYGQILSQRILDLPQKMVINAHASLLPKYRGAAPINWAIINGERLTGVTIIKVVRRMDAGPIISQKMLEIYDNDNAVTLEDRLSCLAARLLIDSLRKISENKFDLCPQDETLASYAPKLKKSDGLIDFTKPAIAIRDLIRGCAGWPGAYCYYNGKMLKLYKAKALNEAPSISSVAGQIVEISKDSIKIATGSGLLQVEELQLEGKRRMQVREFIAGHKVQTLEIIKNKK